MRYLILGGNAAGMSFAAKMKRNQPDCEIIVIERRDYVSFGSCGLPYFVANYFEDEERMIARTVDEFIASNIDLRINEEVISVDKENKSASILAKDGSTYNLSYDKLIVSTGASPIVPDFGTYDKSGVTTLFDLADGQKLKKLINNKQRVAIIGGGFIGLEALDVAHDLNKEITLIEKKEHILQAQISSDMIDVVEENIREHGVNLLTNTGVKSIVDDNGAYIIKTDRGSVAADVIIIAIGFKPNTEFIDVDKERGAIVINQECETSAKDIYALGDCALTYNFALKDYMYLPLATNANKLGRNLAEILSGKKSHFKGMLGTGCIKVLDYEIGFTGVNHSLADKHNLKVKSKIIKTKNQTGYYVGQETLYIKLTYLEDTHVIIGCEIIGKKGAVLRTDSVAVAILSEMTTEELGYIDFCYAPPFATTWDALNVAGNASK